MTPLLSITLFLLLGAGFVLVNLLAGSLIRPRLPNAVKSSAYECGEPTIGRGWVQFDLRFYIVALVFLVFDVEVALFYPWAVAYGQAAEMGRHWGLTAAEFRQGALVDLLIFFAILMVGFAYLWRFGYLDWVHSVKQEDVKPEEAA
jgi:NADH-quinone oxidoreductase subunit A